MLTRLLAILLIISYLNDAQAKASDGLKGASPANCLTDCTCYTPAALTKIAGALNDLSDCRYELSQYHNFAIVKENKAWYEDQTLVIGGLTVSFALGGVLTYFIMKK